MSSGEQQETVVKKSGVAGPAHAARARRRPVAPQREGAPAGAPQSSLARLSRAADSARRSVSVGLEHRATGVPVLSLVRARWAWLVAFTACGLLAGWLAAGTVDVRASATLRLSDVDQDGQRTQQLAQTVEDSAMSAAVLAEAAKARGTSFEDLSSRVRAGWVSSTDLVRVTVVGSDADAVIADANAVAAAVVAREQAGAAARLESLRKESTRVLTSGTLPDRSAEAARRSQLGSSLGSRQDAVAAGAGVVYVSDPAAGVQSAGPSPLVVSLLGGLGGLALGTVAALLVPAGLMRVPRAEALSALAPDLRVRADVDAAPVVAGELLSSARSTLVVLGEPGDAATASRFALVVAGWLDRHGGTVTVLDALAAEPSTLPGPPGTPPEILRALRHTARGDVPGHFGTDLLVVAAEARGDVLGMVCGQDDLSVAIVVRHGKARLGPLRTTATATRDAAPVVVVT